MSCFDAAVDFSLLNAIITLILFIMVLLFNGCLKIQTIQLPQDNQCL